jgi:hypothetical protein
VATQHTWPARPRSPTMVGSAVDPSRIATEIRLTARLVSSCGRAGAARDWIAG